MGRKRRRRSKHEPLTGNKMGLPFTPQQRLVNERQKQREMVQKAQEEARKALSGVKDCPDCSGSGEVTDTYSGAQKVCPKCKGTGELPGPRSANPGSNLSALIGAVSSDPVKMARRLPQHMQPAPMPTSPQPPEQLKPLGLQRVAPKSAGRKATLTNQHGEPVATVESKHEGSWKEPGYEGINRSITWESLIADREPVEVKDDGTEVFMILPHEAVGVGIQIPDGRVITKNSNQVLTIQVPPGAKEKMKQEGWLKPIEGATVEVKPHKPPPRRKGTPWELARERIKIAGQKAKELNTPVTTAVQGNAQWGPPTTPGSLPSPGVSLPSLPMPTLGATYQQVVQPLAQTGLEEIELVETFDLNVGDMVEIGERHGLKELHNISQVTQTGNSTKITLTQPMTIPLTPDVKVHPQTGPGAMQGLGYPQAPAAIVQQVNRVFQQTLEQYVGSNLTAVTQAQMERTVQDMAHRLKQADPLLERLINDVRVLQDPVDPSMIRVEVLWNEPLSGTQHLSEGVVTGIAEGLEEIIPLGVGVNVEAVEPEPEPEPEESPFGKRESFWKLPKS